MSETSGDLFVKIDGDIHVKKEPHICAFGATHVRSFC